MSGASFKSHGKSQSILVEAKFGHGRLSLRFIQVSLVCRLIGLGKRLGGRIRASRKTTSRVNTSQGPIAYK